MRAFLVILFTGLVALAAGIAGFQAGVLSSLGGSGASVVYLAGFPGFGGFLFFLLFAGLILFAIGGRRRRWAGHGPGSFGPTGGHGPWSGGHGPTGDGDPRREWIAEAHRHLHEEEAARATGPAAGTTAGPAGATTDGTQPAA